MKRRRNTKKWRNIIITTLITMLVIPAVFGLDIQASKDIDTDINMLGLSETELIKPENSGIIALGESGHIPLGLSSDISSFGIPAGTSYTIDLVRWGIDGTPTNNSNGINNALDWAAQQGHGTIIFPLGEYMISEHIPINIRNFRDAVIDFNGATIRINSNGLRSNDIVIMEDCRNVKLINGTIQGDIDTHDYTTNPGTTEGNLGIVIKGGIVDCQLDNMIIKDITGWGVVLSKGRNYTSKTHSVSKSNLRSGGINLANGAKTTDSTKIVTINPIDISEFDTFEDKYFILGVHFGYGGYPYLSARRFDVVFYDSNHMVIGSLSDQPVYKKITLPDHVAYVDFAFHQSTLPTKSDSDFNNAVIFITHHIQPTNLHITNTTIDNCRSTGIAICGGDDVTIENCTIKNTGNLAPGYAVNFEDGWEYMNDIKFINNTFESNNQDVVICAGDNAYFRGNRFSGWVYTWPRATNYTFENNTFGNDSNFAISVIYNVSTSLVSTGNIYENVGVMVLKDKPTAEVTFDNEYFNNASINSMSEGVELTNSTIVSDKEAAIHLSGTYRNCDVNILNGEMISSKIYDSTFVARGVAYNQKETLYENCIIKGSDISTRNTTERIAVKSCTITDTIFTITTWGSSSTLDIQDCKIDMLTGTNPLIKFSAGRAENLIFKNNTVTNKIVAPVFSMFDTTYSTPRANLYLEGNSFEQSAYPYIYDGVALKSGVVNVTNVNNKIVGTAEMLNPSYIGNPYTTISTSLNSGGNSGSNTSGNSGGGGSGGGYGGGSTDGSVLSVVTTKAFTLPIGEGLLNTALKTATVGQTVTIRAVNYTSVDLAVLQKLSAVAEKAGVKLLFNFDTMENKTTTLRITVDPSKATANIKLVRDKTKEAKISGSFKKYFANKLEVVSVPVGTQIAVKIPTGFLAEKLVVYGYNAATNKYVVLEHRVDSKGYIHVFVNENEIIIISNGMLQKK